MKNLSTPATRKDIEDILQLLGNIIERFDERFNTIENRLGKVEQRLDRVEHWLLKLEHRLGQLEKTVETHGRHIQGIYGYFDSVAQDLEKHEQERLAGVQLNRREAWILGISKHTGYVLPT